MTRRTIQGALALLLAGGFVLAGTGSAGAGIQPLATIEVSKTVIAEGETITITNSPNDASRCVGGLAVVFVAGAPPGILSQLVMQPDPEGNWSTTWTAPVQADWPSNYVGGPFTFEGICDVGAAPVATPAAVPPFQYEPVVVTIAAATPTDPTTPSTEPSVATTAPAVAAAASAAPRFTG